jgi:hypothetical protein
VFLAQWLSTWVGKIINGDHSIDCFTFEPVIHITTNK